MARAGTRIGKHLTVLGIVEKRGSEPVYIVWHHRDWCPMACKVFESYADARREAKIMSSLHHPNTVRFLGLERPAHLLMEFLEGPTLSRLIRRQRRGRLALSDALRVAIHLGAALAYVHQKGLLHLDVKPSNVIVARGGRPVLYDFGSARRQDARRPPHVDGTDPYIAPEECLRGDIGTAADVFGLGVTLYQMLTGELPFPKGTRRNPFPQTKTEPVPLRQRRPGVPAALAALVQKCLARDPAGRPSLDLLLPALHGFIRGGRPMWPTGFEPQATVPAGRRRAQLT